MAVSRTDLTFSSLQEGFQKYAADIKRFPILSAEEEYKLAVDFRDHHSVEAAHSLITSHLRLVIAISMKYKGYGLPIVDLISEGNIGLMQAVKKFDPDKGFRLATYAIWWIRASIQEYVLRSWSLVKIGTTVAQKKLFFSLNKIKKKINALDNNELRPDEVQEIANALNVPDYEVREMNRRMIGADISLNVPLLSHEGGSTELQDTIADTSQNQEITLGNESEGNFRRTMLQKAMQQLPPRDQEILKARRIEDPPIILEDLSKKYGVSRERVRQIEARAFKTLKENVQKLLEYKKPTLLQ